MYIIDNYWILEETGYLTTVEVEMFNMDLTVINPETLN